MAIRTASNKHRTACSTSGFRDLSCAEGFNNCLWWPWTLQSICYWSSKLNTCQISPKASCSFHSSSLMLHNGRRKLLVSVLRKPGALVKTDDFFFFSSANFKVLCSEGISFGCSLIFFYRQKWKAGNCPKSIVPGCPADTQRVTPMQGCCSKELQCQLDSSQLWAVWEALFLCMRCMDQGMMI